MNLTQVNPVISHEEVDAFINIEVDQPIDIKRVTSPTQMYVHKEKRREEHLNMRSITQTPKGL